MQKRATPVGRKCALAPTRLKKRKLLWHGNEKQLKIAYMQLSKLWTNISNFPNPKSVKNLVFYTVFWTPIISHVVPWSPKMSVQMASKMIQFNTQQALVTSKGRKLRVVKSLKNVGNYSTYWICPKSHKIHLKVQLLKKSLSVKSTNSNLQISKIFKKYWFL